MADHEYTEESSAVGSGSVPESSGPSLEHVLTNGTEQSEAVSVSQTEEQPSSSPTSPNREITDHALGGPNLQDSGQATLILQISSTCPYHNAAFSSWANGGSDGLAGTATLVRYIDGTPGERYAIYHGENGLSTTRHDCTCCEVDLEFDEDEIKKTGVLQSTLVDVS
ncbi:hypothetical protein EJ08DRAFT_692516 [Tothia fuscella]|uniref:Uncharacterized protein n=1 Tax=Tothia fuscella TaxID=1048955 RepID=A0A9P4P3G2_9PEZI|nr:hypothetical protein EJ08DRAFT_692516 [Tothia fuscella]